MIFRWVICFSLGIALAPSATISGRIELRDSRNPQVHRRKDFSGVVVSLRPLDAEARGSAGRRPETILQKDKTFSPHVLAIAKGTIVNFPNADPIFHNAFSSYNGQIFDVGLYPPGSSRAVKFAREGVVRVFCNIHSAMSAVIVVVASPYFATSDRGGSFQIPDVEPGEYELTIFHERASEATLGSLRQKLIVTSHNVSLPAIAISEAGYLPAQHRNKYGLEYPPETRDSLDYPGIR